MNTIFGRLKFALKFISMGLLFGFISVISCVLTPLWVLIWLFTGKFYALSILGYTYVFTLLPLINEIDEDEVEDDEDDI